MPPTREYKAHWQSNRRNSSVHRWLQWEPLPTINLSEKRQWNWVGILLELAKLGYLGSTWSILTFGSLSATMKSIGSRGTTIRATGNKGTRGNWGKNKQTIRIQMNLNPNKISAKPEIWLFMDSGKIKLSLMWASRTSSRNLDTPRVVDTRTHLSMVMEKLSEIIADSKTSSVRELAAITKASSVLHLRVEIRNTMRILLKTISMMRTMALWDPKLLLKDNSKMERSPKRRYRRWEEYIWKGKICKVRIFKNDCSYRITSFSTLVHLIIEILTLFGLNIFSLLFLLHKLNSINIYFYFGV